ncbi:MAG: hypothetical protein CMO98_04150 [Woeseia sp.]|nr:hypothetical protein [Woeseia sp.]
MDNSSKGHIILDQGAVALSGLCLLHCLFLPLTIAGLPFFSRFSDNHLHVEMLVVVIPISVIALWAGFRIHQNISIVISGLVGLLLLTIGGTIMHAAHGEIADRVLTVMGSVILALTHYRNYRLSQLITKSRPY